MAITSGIRGTALTYTRMQCDIRYEIATYRELNQAVAGKIISPTAYLERELYDLDDNGISTFDIRSVVHERYGIDQVKSIRCGVERDECITRSERFQKNDHFENDHCANPLLMKALYYNAIVGG